MSLATVFNYLTGNNNQPGKVDPAAFADRGRALLKTADKNHVEATSQGGADALNAQPENYGGPHCQDSK